MPNFIIAQSSSINYGYVLVIESMTDLADYWLTVRSNRTAADFSNAFHGKQTKAAQYIEIYRDRTGGNLVEAALGVSGRTFEAMGRSIRRVGRVYVQKSGGWFVPFSGLITHTPRKTGTYTFPEVEPEVKIFRWPKGEHWYATVDGQAVVDTYGREKWDFYYEAQAAVRTFLAHNQKQKRIVGGYG